MQVIRPLIQEVIRTTNKVTPIKCTKHLTIRYLKAKTKKLDSSQREPTDRQLLGNSNTSMPKLSLETHRKVTLFKPRNEKKPLAM